MPGHGLLTQTEATGNLSSCRGGRGDGQGRTGEMAGMNSRCNGREMVLGHGLLAETKASGKLSRRQAVATGEVQDRRCSGHEWACA